MHLPAWYFFLTVFVFGCCVGSFLNVVIYRLPREMSLWYPPSSCPGCGKRIRFYDNIPLVSWLVLGRKCRFCRAAISCRYFVIELLTGLVFVFVLWLYFYSGLRSGVGSFLSGGWVIYLSSTGLICCLIAASAIDLKLWVIPLSICWTATAIGLGGSAAAPFFIKAATICSYALAPYAGAKTANLAAGAAVGLACSLFFVATGLIKKSYESPQRDQAQGQPGQGEPEFNHRLEVCREILFLLPVVVCSAGFYLLADRVEPIRSWWLNFVQHPVIAGLLGSVWGYFVGCGVVWATRILGTLGFGREAMGLGDVHLMGAAGAVIGGWFIVIAFFIAPFFGLAWAGAQMLTKKTRQIPYGPFLSLGVVAAMILHDRILNYVVLIFCQ